MNKTELKHKLEARIRADIDREAFDNAQHKAIAKILAEKFAGKKLTRRIVDYYRQTLPENMRDRVIYYGDDYGAITLQIWGKEVPHHATHDKRLHMMIASSDRKDDFDVAEFERADICHGKPAEDRNAQRLALLESGELDRICGIVEEIEAKRGELNELISGLDSPGNPICYEPEVYHAANGRSVN